MGFFVSQGRPQLTCKTRSRKLMPRDGDIPSRPVATFVFNKNGDFEWLNPLQIAKIHRACFTKRRNYQICVSPNFTCEDTWTVMYCEHSKREIRMFLLGRIHFSMISEHVANHKKSEVCWATTRSQSDCLMWRWRDAHGFHYCNVHPQKFDMKPENDDFEFLNPTLDLLAVSSLGRLKNKQSMSSSFGWMAEIMIENGE